MAKIAVSYTHLDVYKRQIWADLDVKGMTIRIINVHMQTTNFDRMRSKAAQARGAQDLSLIHI